MKKILLMLSLAVLLCSCSSSNEPVADVAPNTQNYNSESEINSEVKDTPEIVENTPDVLNDDNVIETKSGDMDFATCVKQQSETAEAISSSGNYKVISIVDTDIVSMVKFCTNDNPVIHTCSAPDNKVIVTKTRNREGC
ncbi:MULTISPECIES: hypothetical protein [Psychrobacter]|uniref:hypothetical protein n=1 Tax=Psychrobacter TaxID=497 RepID=UPI00146AFEA1|nr:MULTISPECIES: hypothetical protein [Psychrobacter]